MGTTLYYLPNTKKSSIFIELFKSYGKMSNCYSSHENQKFQYFSYKFAPW